MDSTAKLYHIHYQLFAGNHAAITQKRVREFKMMVANLATPVQPVSYETIRGLMAPAAHPMPAEEIEKRRRAAAELLGRPFPKCSREEAYGRKVKDLSAIMEWGLLDTLHQGLAPHVKHLATSR